MEWVWQTSSTDEKYIDFKTLPFLKNFGHDEEREGEETFGSLGWFEGPTTYRTEREHQFDQNLGFGNPIDGKYFLWDFFGLGRIWTEIFGIVGI